MKFWRKVLMIAVAATLGAGFFAGDAEAAWIDSVVVRTPASGGLRGIDSTIVVDAYVATGGDQDEDVRVYFWLSRKDGDDWRVLAPEQGGQGLDIEAAIDGNADPAHLGSADNFIAARARIGMDGNEIDADVKKQTDKAPQALSIGDADSILVTKGPTRPGAVSYTVTAYFSVNHMAVTGWDAANDPEKERAIWPHQAGVVAFAMAFDPAVEDPLVVPAITGWTAPKRAMREHAFTVNGIRPFLRVAEIRDPDVLWKLDEDENPIPRWTMGYDFDPIQKVPTGGIGDQVEVTLDLSGPIHQRAVDEKWGITARFTQIIEKADGTDSLIVSPLVVIQHPGQVNIQRQVDAYPAAIQEGLFGDLDPKLKFGYVSIFVTDQAGNLSTTIDPISGMKNEAQHPNADAQNPNYIPLGLTESVSFLIDAKSPKLSLVAASDTLIADGTVVFSGAGSDSIKVSRGTITTIKIDNDTSNDVLVLDENSYVFKPGETLSRLEITFDNLLSKVDAPSGPGNNCDTLCEGSTGVVDPSFKETYVIKSSVDGFSSSYAIPLEDDPLLKGEQKQVDWKLLRARRPAVTYPVVADSGYALKTGLYKMTVKAFDLAGNTSEAVVDSNVYVDMDPIDFNSLAPTAIAAKLDTLNQELAMVKFQLSEPADSVSIRMKGIDGTYKDSTFVRPLTASELVNSGLQEFALVGNLALGDNTKYAFSVVGRDLAGNYTATSPVEFWYRSGYEPPQVQRFVVTSYPSGGRRATSDSALYCHLNAGDLATLTITAVASLDEDKPVAVTYKGDAELRVDLGFDRDALTMPRGLSLNGEVSPDGRLALDGSGWVDGVYTVTLMNTTVIDTLWVTVVSADEQYAGLMDWPFVYDPGPYSQILVSAPDTVGQGEIFPVEVTLADKFGNRVYHPGGENHCPDPALEPVCWDGYTVSRYVDIIANKLGVEVPTGNRMYVGQAHAIFDARVNNWQGEGLVFRIMDTGVTERGDNWITPINKLANQPRWEPLAGVSNAITVVPPEQIATLDAPDTLIAKDYMGADGQGDQGGFVMMTWDLSEDHAHLTGYRIYREMMVDYTTDEDGKLVELTNSTMDWVPWAKVDAVPGANIGRAIVATLDNVATHWGIAAERGSRTTAVAAKEVFEGEAEGTDEPVFAVLTSEALAFIENGTAIQAKFVDGLLRSEITATVEPVRAIDNIPPKPVPFLRAMDTPSDVGGSITLSWTQSEDDRLLPRFHAAAVGPTTADQVPGVLGYNIYRKVGNESFTLIGRAAAGATSFADATALNGVRYTYQVRPYDLDNETAAVLERTAMAIRNIVFDAAGERIYGLFGMTNQVGFDDFFIFADNFGLTRDDPAFEPAFDLTGSGRVDFDDFFVFADNFGRVARLAAGKAVPTLAGMNRDARLYLDAGTQLPRVGEEVVIDVSLADFVALKGYGFNVSFDAEQLEFVKVVADNNPLGEGVLAQPLVIAQTDGNVAIAAHGEPVSQGELGVSLVFRTRTEIENTFIEVNQSEVRDDSYGTNLVSLPAPVQIQTLPAQYALGNNYPNPFNPATTIRYALPEAAFVKLEIYNVVGQVVRTLVADQQHAGRYVVQWNASDDNGRSLSSGIYFYRLQAGSEFREVKKMLLLK